MHIMKDPERWVGCAAVEMRVGGEEGRAGGDGKGEGMPEMDDSEFIQNPDTINRCIDKL